MERVGSSSTENAEENDPPFLLLKAAIDADLNAFNLAIGRLNVGPDLLAETVSKIQNVVAGRLCILRLPQER